MSDQIIASDRDQLPPPREPSRRNLFKQAGIGAAALSAFAMQNSVFAKAASAATDPSLLTDVN
ncbi:hypothetical protein, partial [Rhizosaccharibacter radicis]|nr:hypothetical protein [Acetobacteraceae bacterium KSS12]